MIIDGYSEQQGFVTAEQIAAAVSSHPLVPFAASLNDASFHGNWLAGPIFFMEDFVR